MEYTVILNKWTREAGWISEEAIDTILNKMSAELYVNSLEEDNIEEMLDCCDGIMIEIVDGDGNKVSEYWLDE